MVSQDLSKEPVSSVLHHCAVSDMEAFLSCSGGLHYCSHWDGIDRDLIRPHNLAQSFQPVSTPMNRSMEPFSVRSKEYTFASCSDEHGHGLSLSLGPESEPNNAKLDDCNQGHIIENITGNKTVIGGVICEPLCSYTKYPRDDCMICDADVASSIYTSGNSNLKFHSIMINLLQKSPYLKAAQQLLDEVVCVGNSVLKPSSNKNVLRKNQIIENMCSAHFSKEKKEGDRMARLVALQEELKSRHDQYFHQMDELVSSFEVVGGAGSSAAYTALTSQAMSKHFSNLREAIVAHMNFIGDVCPEDVSRNHKLQSGNFQHLDMIHVRQIWRPLRGLPEDSVMVLRAWLFEHFLHPYPNDNEKLLLASKTGLTRNQISNWFINARVRLWKPMIEEMYRKEFEEDEDDSNPS